MVQVLMFLLSIIFNHGTDAAGIKFGHASFNDEDMESKIVKSHGEDDYSSGSGSGSISANNEDDRGGDDEETIFFSGSISYDNWEGSSASIKHQSVLDFAPSASATDSFSSLSESDSGSSDSSSVFQLFTLIPPGSMTSSDEWLGSGEMGVNAAFKPRYLRMRTMGLSKNPTGVDNIIGENEHGYKHDHVKLSKYIKSILDDESANISDTEDVNSASGSSSESSSSSDFGSGSYSGIESSTDGDRKAVE